MTNKRTITVADIDAGFRGRFVTVGEGMSGHYALVLWWNDREGMPGFWEPATTGIGRYATEDEARVEAIALSDSEGIPYCMPDPQHQQDA